MNGNTPEAFSSELLDATAGPRWLHLGTAVEGTLDLPLRDVHLVYDAEQIRFVGPDGRLPPPDCLRPGQTAPDLVAPTATALPGLIEAHAHLFLEGGELNFDRRAAYLQQSPETLLALARERMPRLLAHGIIAVRDAGDKDGVGLALSRACRADPKARVPYLDSPGAALHHAGRYGGFMGEPLEEFSSASEAVADRVAAGADRLKLIPTGIINFKKGAVTAKPQMTTDEVAALVTAARRHHRQTFAHASGDDGIEHALEGGVDTIEHGFFIRNDQLARLRDRDIGWVPTFAPVQRQVDHAERFGWDPTIVDHLRRILDGHAASLRRAHALGVRIIAGSDAGSCGVAHARDFLYELELMEAAGLPPLAVLNAATGDSATRLAFHQPFGRLAIGQRPRFLLTSHPVLYSVRHLRARPTVIFDGVVIPPHDSPEIGL